MITIDTSAGLAAAIANFEAWQDIERREAENRALVFDILAPRGGSNAER
ncbi:MAG: hypothetical protein ACRD3D_01140 [Terriglobia bacterium]